MTPRALSLIGLTFLVGCGGGGGTAGGSGGSGGGGGFDLTGAGGGGDMVQQPEGCTKDPIASGTLKTSVAAVPVTSTAKVAMSMKHKLDIDPVEDGCVTRFAFSVRLHPQGCDLKGEFSTSVADNVKHLSYLSFKADSFCPNFLDKDEGNYSLFRFTIGGKAEQQSEVGVWLTGLPDDVPGDQLKAACMTGTTLTFPDADIHMYRSGDAKELVVNLKDLVIKGDLRSTGDTEEACPATTGCPAPHHNGGALTCYGTTYCADGYTFANNTCSK